MTINNKKWYLKQKENQKPIMCNYCFLKTNQYVHIFWGININDENPMDIKIKVKTQKICKNCWYKNESECDNFQQCKSYKKNRRRRSILY